MASTDTDPAGEPVEIYTDGACSGNPGPGGWAAVLRWGESERQLSGADPATTNNRMELKAAIEALESLPGPVAIILHTDSEYVRNGIEKWLPNWKRRGWRTADNRPVKNRDLWTRLDEAAGRHRISWRWVRGHAGDAGNELADRLAREALAAGRSRPPAA